VFRGSATASLDCARLVNEEVFVTGDDTGCVPVTLRCPPRADARCRSVQLWGINKKKPLDTLPNAHGPGRWICSVGAWRYSDVVRIPSLRTVYLFWRLGG
jgi:hypothetical protein